jgi:uncharacterized membrane protein YgdD (TMEM256/DUF423 family)
MIRIIGIIACLMGAAGVGLAAFGAHGGWPRAETASRFLLFHAPALLALLALGRAGLLAPRLGRFAVMLLVAGVVFFTGDLVLRDIGFRVPGGFIAPLGGMGMIGGWALAGVAFLLKRG